MWKPVTKKELKENKVPVPIEKKAEIYYLKVPTFRRTVELHIG
jgi:hypothetical protein